MRFAGGKIDAVDDADSSKIGVVQQGESCDLIGTFKNGNTAIAKSSLATLTVTLYDETSSQIINTQEDTDILDANNGVVTDAGELTLRLQPADNPIVDSGSSLSVGDREVHIARFTYTWDDGVLTRTGIQEVKFRVQKVATPAAP